MTIAQNSTRPDSASPSTAIDRRFATKLWHATSAADRLALAVLAGLIVLASMGKTPSPRLLGTMFAVAAGMLALPLLGARSRGWRIVHELSPIAWVPVLFNLCGPTIVALNPARWDTALAASDVYLFGGLVPAWRGLLGRPDWLTDAASVAYGSFYFIPMAVALGHYLRRDMVGYGRSILAIQLAFYLPFIGYFAMPALGPRVPVAEEAVVLGGGAVSAALRAFLRVGEVNVLDAFPSGHTSVSVTSMILAWKSFPRARPVFTIWCASIVFSTVYLSLHYVTDLVAGVGVAIASVALVAPLGSRIGLAREG